MRQLKNWYANMRVRIWRPSVEYTLQRNATRLTKLFQVRDVCVGVTTAQSCMLHLQRHASHNTIPTKLQVKPRHAQWCPRPADVWCAEAG